MKKRRGFTLLEMSIVLFIISLLVLIILPNISRQRQNALHIHKDAMTNVIQTQSELYTNETGRRAANLKELADHHYLSKNQLSRAQREHIVLHHGKVSHS